MNEPSSVGIDFILLHPWFFWFTYYLQFCVFPCDDPFKQATEQNLPPPRSAPPPNPNTPIFLNSTGPSKRDDTLNPSNLRLKRGPYGFSVNSGSQLSKRDNILIPPYAINNAAGPLSSRTAYVCIFFYLKIIITNPETKWWYPDRFQAREWLTRIWHP